MTKERVPEQSDNLNQNNLPEPDSRNEMNEIAELLTIIIIIIILFDLYWTIGKSVIFAYHHER